MKSITRFIVIIFIFSMIWADGQSPIFMPIEPTEDFYSGSDVHLEVQISDQSSILDVYLYYRFSTETSFSSIPMVREISYMGIIPGVDVIPGRMEYYFFARDEHGNQSTWPVDGENAPEGYPVFEPLLAGGSHGNISIDLLNPPANETSKDASIIILSLYDPEGSIDLNNIRLIVDNVDVSKFIYKSVDMVTYVPNIPLESGKHKVEFQLADDEGIFLHKKFKFKLAEIDLSFAEKIDWRKKFKFKGNISYNSDYDEFFGKDRPENRPMDSHKLNTSFKLRIGNVKIKTSALFNTHLMDKDAQENLERRQPINRIKFGLSSPYLDFRYGDFSTEFSEFSLKGTRVRGIYTKFKLGPWNTSIVSGNTKEQISSITETEIDSIYWTQIFLDVTEDDSTFTFVNHTKGTASRRMKAFRTELDFSKFNFGISALTSYDDLDEYNLEFNELYNQYTFLGNAVVGTDFTLLLNNKKTQFKAETAISLMNDLRGTPVDKLAESLDMPENQLNETKKLFNKIEDLVGFNINSDMIIGSSEGRGISVPLPDMDSLDASDYLINYLINDVIKQGTYRLTFKTPLEFDDYNFDFNAVYKRVPANFVSLGNSSIQTDIQGIKSSLKTRLFENQLSINLNYENEHDNLMGDKPEEKLKTSTTTSNTSSAGFGLTLSELPSINYSFRTLNRQGISVEDNSITASNKTITHTISPSYKFDLKSGTNVSMNGNIMYMMYKDNLYNPNDTSSTNSNFTTGSYTGSFALRFDSPLTINMGGGLSVNTPESVSIMSTHFFVLSTKVGYKFWEKALSTFLGLNLVSGGKDADANGEGEIDNLKLTIKGGAQYKIAKNMSIGLNVDFISLTDNVSADNDYSELKGKIKFKIGF